MRAFDRAILLPAGITGGCVSGHSTWNDCIIFNFFYSEYWHYRLVLSFCAKAEVHSFEVRVGMRFSDYVVRVLIYYNLPDLLQV